MTDECETCGAAKNPGLVACSYCETGLSLLGQAASAPSARGILGEVFQDLVENAVKKR